MSRFPGSTSRFQDLSSSPAAGMDSAKDTDNPVPVVSVGWTDLPIHGSARLIFVSTAGSDSNDGLSSGSPKATIAAGIALLRNNQADRLLLKRGDVWTEELHISDLNGISATYPFVLGAYGTGARPKIHNVHEAVKLVGTCTYGAILDIEAVDELYNGDDSRDLPYGVVVNGQCSNILLENLHSHHNFVNIAVEASEGANHSNITIRRCIAHHAYKIGPASHAQGIFVSFVDNLLLEENISDHNGWNEDVAGADPTVFRHNFYIYPGRTTGVVTRRNITARAAATGFRSFGASATANLVLKCPVGLALSPDSLLVQDNVILDSRDIVSGNPIGAGIAGEAAGVEINGNILAGREDTATYNVDAFQLDYQHGNSGAINLHDNICYNWAGPDGTGDLLHVNGGSVAGLAVRNNDFQMAGNSRLIVFDPAGTVIPAFSGNRYFSASATPFATPGPDQIWLSPYANWVTATGETGSSFIDVDYPDPGRTAATYMASIGETATLAAFLQAACDQDRDTWHVKYGALAVINYVRAGFGLDPVAAEVPSGNDSGRRRMLMGV